MMQSKRFRALAMVGALTLAVCTGTTAMAEEAAPMGNSPEIQKIFQMSEGMDVPSVSFKFTLEKVTADAPTAQVSPINYNSNTDKGNLTNGVYLMQKNQQINFGEFPHGTKIDYPFAQADNNTKYVNTDITGEFALSGSLFLDCQNAADFTDLNHVIYGHHMEKKTMLGELESFAERPFFEEHRYGRLYYNGQDHGLEFIAFLETDAYDDMIYNVTLTEDEQEKYLSCLREKAMYYRETELSVKEHFLALSTCDSGRTNGRYVLVGRITEEMYENPFAVKSKK